MSFDWRDRPPYPRDEPPKQEHVHELVILGNSATERQHPGTLTVWVGCTICETAWVSTMMEPCPWPQQQTQLGVGHHLAEPTDA